jgi:hypothetical protein
LLQYGLMRANPGRHELLALTVLLGALTGCGGAKKRVRDPKAVVLDRPSAQHKAYADEALALRAPVNWSVQAVAGGGKDTHLVDIRNGHGLFARVTLVHGSGEPETFTSQVVQRLRAANRTLSVKPHSARLADREAKGYRYAFKAGDTRWGGWVVAYAGRDAVIGFLGQFPGHREPLLAPVLTEVMKSLRLKGRSITRATTTTTTP